MYPSPYLTAAPESDPGKGAPQLDQIPWFHWYSIVEADDQTESQAALNIVIPGHVITTQEG